MEQEQTRVEPSTEHTEGDGRMATVVVAIVSLLVLAAIVAGALLLLLPSGSKGGKVLALEQRPPKGTPYVDALVIDTKGGNFDLLTQHRKREVIYIRKPDRPLIDVQHAKTHAALGQPVRIYTRKVGGKTVAIYMEDSPVLF